MAYIAEQYFGIADITGAYIAGIVLCSLEDASYIERRVDISSYTLFAPVFFASIGLKTDISGPTPTIPAVQRLLRGGGPAHQDHRLRSGREALPVQLGRLPQR